MMGSLINLGFLRGCSKHAFFAPFATVFAISEDISGQHVRLFDDLSQRNDLAISARLIGEFHGPPAIGADIGRDLDEGVTLLPQRRVFGLKAFYVVSSFFVDFA
jgi:hypothetical protein